MNGLRLLVCDLDGTLLDPDGTVSGRTELALDALRSAGVEVAIATGRIPRGIVALAHRLGIDGPQITMHGGLVVDLDTHQTVFSEALAPSQVDELVAVGSELGLPTLLCYPDGFRTNQLRPEVAALFVPYDEPLPVVAADLGELRASHPHKVAIWTGRDGYDAALAVVRERLGGRYAITSGDDKSIEILPPGVDKGRATGALARWLGLTTDQVAAIGDGTNDIELLGGVGQSVAMRHARPEVRAAATQVIPDDLTDEPSSAIGLLFPDLVFDGAGPSRAERPA